MRGAKLADAALGLERAGAELLLIGANTMHIVAEQVKAAIGIPLIQVAEATARDVRAAGLHDVALLVAQEDAEVPLFDTTRIHAVGAVDAALAD